MKKKYSAPSIEEIRLDNEISLQLASTPTVPGSSLELVKRQEPGMTPDADPYQYDTW